MSEFIGLARKAALRIKKRHCCYGTERTNVRDFCDCKFLSGDYLGSPGSEDTGCAEARTIRDFLAEVERTGSYDAGELERCRELARRLQRACCLTNAAEPPPADLSATSVSRIRSSRHDTIVGLRDPDTDTVFDMGDSTSGDLTGGEVAKPEEEPVDETEIPRSPLCLCGCAAIKKDEDSGNGCYEGWVLRDALRRIKKEYPSRVNDQGVRAKAVVVIVAPTTLRLKFKGLVEQLKDAGQLPAVWGALVAALRLRNAEDAVAPQLQKALEGQLSDEQPSVALNSKSAHFSPISGLSLPADQLSLVLPVSMLAEAILDSRYGQQRFIQTCIALDYCREGLSGVVYPVETAHVVYEADEHS